MSVDTPEQLAGVKRVGQLVASTLSTLRAAVAPGVSTGELDALASTAFAAHGARPGPILTYGYPASICVSIDDEVVHGIPGKRRFKDGQLVKLDVAIERTANARGFEVFKELTGHGIGREMHEPPTVFNWPAPEANQQLAAGLVFTIEPMLASGGVSLKLDPDGWTVRTRDGTPSAHEEHTIMVATGGPVVLTARS